MDVEVNNKFDELKKAMEDFYIFMYEKNKDKLQDDKKFEEQYNSIIKKRGLCGDN